MWKCPNCETVNNTEKCIVCGQEKPKYSANTQQRICVNCGAKLDNGMEFCGECGTSVNTTYGGTLVEDNSKQRNKGKLLIISLIAIIAILVTVIIAYLVHQKDNVSITNDTEEAQILTESTPTPQNTSIPANNETENDDTKNEYVASDRADLYNSSLTYKRMPEIHNSVLVDNNTFSVLKNIIEEFEVQCADYMNETTNEVPPYLKVGTTAYNQQVEHKQKHPTLDQSYQTVDVVTARQGGGYYYVWVTEVLNVTENGVSRMDTDHWVYKIANENGHWYIYDYTYDPAF